MYLGKITLGVFKWGSGKNSADGGGSPQAEELEEHIRLSRRRNIGYKLDETSLSPKSTDPFIKK